MAAPPANLFLTQGLTMKFKTLAIAAALVASAGAHAAIEGPGSNTGGNSSVLFLAIDVNNNTGLVLDLGLSMADFTNSTTYTSGLFQTGAKTWNFANDTNDLGVTDTAWSAAYNTFKNAQSGGDLVWGVVAADQVSTGSPNLITGRGLLSTGNATQAQMLAASTNNPTGNAIGIFLNFAAAANNFGTHTSVANGAGATTSANGNAWLPNSMGVIGNGFGGNITWNSLVGNGVSSTFQYQRQTSTNPVVFQFGEVTATDSLAARPITFTFDIATDSLVLAPVPEPQTYALMLAGLGVVSFLARRRRAA
jgi:PEP-CTERM motif